MFKSDRPEGPLRSSRIGSIATIFFFGRRLYKILIFQILIFKILIIPAFVIQDFDIHPYFFVLPK
jgi:hypothetical protein